MLVTGSDLCGQQRAQPCACIGPRKGVPGCQDARDPLCHLCQPGGLVTLCLTRED